MTTSHDAASVPSTSISSVVGRLIFLIEKELSSGDRAALRKMTAEDEGAPAFWKMAVSVLIPGGFMSDSVGLRELQEKDWITILSALATMEGLHAPQQRLGRVLAEAEFSELRLTRLLRAEGISLHDQVRLMTTFLRSKGSTVDMADVARLVLTNSSDRRVQFRRQVASDYYSNIRE